MDGSSAATSTQVNDAAQETSNGASPPAGQGVKEKSSLSNSTKPRSGILKSAGSRPKGSANSQKTRFSAPSPDEAASRSINNQALLPLYIRSYRYTVQST